MPPEAEFVFSLPEQFLRGLSPRREATLNRGGLRVCNNVLARGDALIEPPSITDPFSSLPEPIGFPFPQLLFGERQVFLAYANSLYSVDVVTDPSSWTASPVDVRDSQDPSVAGTIPAATEPWDWADFGDFWMMFSDSSILLRVHKEGLLTGGVDHVMVHTPLVFRTGVRHRGRTVVGGLVSGAFWNPTWAALWNYWLGLNGEGFAFDANVDAPDSSYVVWSGIGGEGLPLSLIFPDLVDSPGPLPGTPGLGSDEPYAFELMRRNQMGWIRMPFEGSVLKLLPLGDDLIVYCENGVARLTPVADPVPTYGLRIIARFGAVSKGAIGGDDNQHLFMDATGTLWLLDVREGLVELGFEEEFSSIAAGDVAVTLDQRKRRFYICVSSVIRVLSEGRGLSLITPYLALTSGLSFRNAFVGVRGDVSSTTATTIPEIETEELDFGTRSLKQLTRIEVGWKGRADLTPVVLVSWKNSPDDAFTTAGPFSITKEGWAFPNVTAMAFRVRLTFTIAGANQIAYTGFELHYLKFYYQISVKTQIRGPS